MANGGLSSGTTSVSAWVCGESTSGIRVVFLLEPQALARGCAENLPVEFEWWLLTWRTYGTFVPGEAGFVGYYRNRSGDRVIDNVYDSPTAPSMPALADYSRRVQSEDACFLTSIQAQCLLSQFRETCQYRGWSLLAAAILANHVHAVIGLPDTVVGASAMKDLKSYGSRALNLSGGISKRRSWWAIGGSCRRLVSGEYRENAMEYVCRQVTPLALWHTDDS